MSSPSSSTLQEVIENVMENVQRERVEQPENQETVPVEGVREEAKKMEVEAGEVRVFITENGVETFKKTLSKKGFIEESELKEFVLPFKEEIEKR